MGAPARLWQKSLSFVLLISAAVGHVGLKYPKARKFDLDFLDSYRTSDGEGTSKDCGMPEGTERTVLEAGSTLNVTWSLGYAHKGGYKIELINGTQSKLLAPDVEGQQWVTGDALFAQYHVVTLPDIACDKCFLRLQRQASEWAEDYVFRSCADVTLVQQSSYKEECSGHGTLTAGPPGAACQCQKLYTGNRCQYKVLCDTDEDCNGSKGQGACVETDNAIYSDRKCFCAAGWFGDACEKQSDFTSHKFNKSAYIRTQLETHKKAPKLHWIIEDGELEMIVEATTTSWVAVGWRPADLSIACQKFPREAVPPRGQQIHPMDCTDMVIGMARDGRGFVADYYTRDRSTPNRDAFWGGEDDLRSGLVYEANGTTTLMFRKSIKGGVADQSFGGQMHFIWATGQDKGFYKADQLKYHGPNRGHLTLNFPRPGYTESPAQQPTTHILALLLAVLPAMLLL